MKWRYGAVENFDGTYSCHEIYLDADGGKSWTSEPVTFVSDTLDGLAASLRQAWCDLTMGLLESQRRRSVVTLAEQEEKEQ